MLLILGLHCTYYIRIFFLTFINQLFKYTMYIRYHFYIFITMKANIDFFVVSRKHGFVTSW